MAYEEILTKTTGVSVEPAQGLTATQQADARSNIGAVSKAGDTMTGALTVGGATIAKGASANIIGTTKQATTVSNQLVLQQGAVFSGTAANAGLVTRGICGVSTPDNDGACNKENLYINYDGTNDYNSGRQLILQAGTAGDHYGNNLYQYAAARGDAVKGWVEAQGYTNQNAFSNVKVGNTTVAAENTTDTLTLEAGTNITLTPDATNDKITIKANIPVATSTVLGGVKSGTDITVDSNGNVSVKDNSHNHIISNVDNLQSTLDAKVPTSRTVNGKALSANITLSASDVSAAPASHASNTAIHVPACTTSDNGKVLMVVNGTPTWVTLNLTMDSNGVVSLG